MMDDLKIEEVAINLKLWKLYRFYQMLKPNNNKKIFNCNVNRLILFIYGAIVSCMVVYSTIGFFVEMDGIISEVDIFLALVIMINFFFCSWRMCLILSKCDTICDVLNVSQLNFLKSKQCHKHLNVLYKYRDRMIKITNYFLYVSLMVMLQWIIYPLVVIAFTRPEMENGRLQNVLNLRFPVSTYTYNQHYFIFYLIEVVLTIFIMYVMIMPDILIMSICCAIMAQQEVLTRAFKNIGHEDNSQIGNIFFLKQ